MKPHAGPVASMVAYDERNLEYIIASCHIADPQTLTRKSTCILSNDIGKVITRHTNELNKEAGYYDSTKTIH